MAKRQPLETAIASLRRAQEEPHTEASQTMLRDALTQRQWLLVSEAAKIVGERTLAGFNAELLKVWARFTENGAKTDPGCRAKEAALTALDQLEVMTADPFLPALRYRQLEPGLGGSTDTAGGVRLRGLFALFRMCHPDALLYAGELLADPEHQVRSGAAQALGHYGDRQGAALLLHKLHGGDKEPSVLADCAAALLNLAPDFALEILKAWLFDSSEVRRESAALTLGQSRNEAAIGLLIAWLDDSGSDADFALGVHALGLSRDERARDYLLHTVETASPARARRAIEALGTHHYDDRLKQRVQVAAGKNPRAQLEPIVARVFRSA